MNEVCQSGSWDGGGVGENDQNWEEVKGQVREDCRGAGEMDGEGPLWETLPCGEKWVPLSQLRHCPSKKHPVGPSVGGLEGGRTM